MPIKKQQLAPYMEKQTGSKLGKEYTKAVYCHSAYLTYMQSTSLETLGWVKHKLESRLLGEIAVTSVMQMTPPLQQKVKKKLKSLLMIQKEESEKKYKTLTTFKKLRSWHLFPSLHGKYKGKTAEKIERFYFWGSKIIADCDCSHKIKRHFLL